MWSGEEGIAGCRNWEEKLLDVEWGGGNCWM